jgi:hypothetical protein
MRSVGDLRSVVFQHLAHVVHAMRLSPSAHCFLKGFPDLILIGRQPNNRFQVTEPGVQERLVVGDPMLNTRGWSCFSQLILAASAAVRATDETESVAAVSE